MNRNMQVKFWSELFVGLRFANPTYMLISFDQATSAHGVRGINFLDS